MHLLTTTNYHYKDMYATQGWLQVQSDKKRHILQFILGTEFTATIIGRALARSILPAQPQ